MNWDAIGAIGEIVGALAVVVSLLYLATQIRTSNKVAIRETTVEINRLTYEDSKFPLENPNIARLLLKLQNREPELSEQEKVEALWYAYVRLNHWAAAQHSVLSGLVPEKLETSYMNSMTAVIKNYPGLNPYLASALRDIGIDESYNKFFTHLWSELKRADANET